MKTVNKLILQMLLASAFFSCNNSTTKPGQTNDTLVTPADSSKKIAVIKNAGDSSKENAMSVTAMFIDFTLGDASHFTFKDQSGKTWDFADNEDSTYKFAQELPKNKSNATNQGWGSDKTLQGKWFNIKYIYRNQPEYPDGPMAKVPVIIEAKLKM